jgi:activating signal cointegrator complex subunit 3
LAQTPDLQNQEWEEVRLPASTPAPPRDAEARVPISAFSRVAQLAFRGFEELNRIQSFVFETAYKTSENMLICAPTGAGKTNIAMMAVLHEVERHIVQGVIQRDQFKIVYVAPMKALAAEMTASFGKR